MLRRVSKLLAIRHRRSLDTETPRVYARGVSVNSSTHAHDSRKHGSDRQHVRTWERVKPLLNLPLTLLRVSRPLLIELDVPLSRSRVTFHHSGKPRHVSRQRQQRIASVLIHYPSPMPGLNRDRPRVNNNVAIRRGKSHKPKVVQLTRRQSLMHAER